MQLQIKNLYKNIRKCELFHYFATTTIFCRVNHLIGLLYKGISLVNKLVFNVLITSIFFVVLFFLFKEINTINVIVYPFDVPESMSRMGLSGRVVANRVVDKIYLIKNESYADQIWTEKYTPSWQDSNFDVEVTNANISIKKVVDHLKEYFGYGDIYVYGDVVSESNGESTLTIRINKTQSHSYKFKNYEIDSPIQSASVDICKDINPFALASYLLSIDHVKCKEVLDYIISKDKYKNKYKSFTYNLYGLLLAGSDRLEAIIMFKKSLEADPSFYAAYLNWANVLKDMKKLDEAKDLLEKLTKKFPDESHTYVSLANILIEKSDLDGAILQCKKSLELDASSAWAYSTWGFALIKKGNNYLPDAISKLRKAITIEPNNVGGHIYLGYAFEKMGDNKAAIEQYKLVMKLDAYNALNYFRWGWVLQRSGDKFGAIEKYRKAIECNNYYIDAYNNLGVLLCESNAVVMGINYFNKVIDIDPKDAQAYRNWGTALKMVGNYEEALAKLKRAQYCDPTNQQIADEITQLNMTIE